MSDELRDYFRRELEFLKNEAAIFGKAYPKLAERLQLNADRSRDPHTERLLEGVAYLTARIRAKLDDDYPELAEALLNIVCPHYLRPLPSAAIAQFELDPRQTDLSGCHTVPAGTPVETAPVDGEPCRFQTRYPVDLWPIRLERAVYRQNLGKTIPSELPLPRAMLRIDFATFSTQIGFKSLRPGKLRLHLNGRSQFTYELYEQLINDSVGIAIARSGEDGEPVVARAARIRPVGFEADEALLPVDARSMWGYQLLSEFFAYPERFLFVDIEGLSPRDFASVDNRLELTIYFKQSVRNLERFVGNDSLCLGCAPMVNLFEHEAEPIDLDQRRSEYRVVPSERQPRHYEVFSVRSVSAVDDANREQFFSPFFSLRHRTAEHGNPAFWYATRRPAHMGEMSAEDPGTEVYLSLVDLDFQPSRPQERSLRVNAICSNRDVASKLNSPPLTFEAGGAIAKARCLSDPSPTYRPPAQRGQIWRLVSQLSLNYLSLTGSGSGSGEAGGADAIRDLLSIYEFTGSQERQDMIDGVKEIAARRVVCRVPPDPRFPLEDEGPGFCRGLEIRLGLAESKFTGGNAFLFASVLERFFALYASHNSFTQLIAYLLPANKELRKWEPRAGDRVLH